MSAPEFERILGEHAKTEKFRTEATKAGFVTWGVRCICGQELAWGDGDDHRKHLAAALNAEWARYLADEGTRERVGAAIDDADDGTVVDLAMWRTHVARAALAALAPTDTTADEGQVILGQIGEHCEPGPCSACGKSASACGRAREYCCSPCSTSRFETHHTTADEGGAR